MTIKAVLFDLDNTLYDYDSAHKKSIKGVYDELVKHMEITYPYFLKLFKISRNEIHRELAGTASAHNRVLYFQRLIEKTHEKLEPTIVLKLYNAYWNTLLKIMKLRQGSLKILEYCKKNNIKVAIVSDLTTNIQLRKIEKLKISKYVDVLVTSEEAGSEKPHAIMFLLALNKLKILPSDALMVGDNTINDIEGANFVGLKTVLLNKGSLSKLPKEDYQKPDYTINKVSELLTVISDVNLQKVIDDGYIKFNCNFKKTKPILADKIKKLSLYRQKLYNSKLVGAYPNKIGYGNVSEKQGKYVIITGSTTGNYKKLDNTKFSRITKYDINKNELHCTGAIKASSESMTHEAIYECDKNIGAVIHVHNLKMWNKFLNKLPTTSETAAYGTPEIAFEIKRLYDETDLKDKKIAVLGGHKEGLIAFGKDLNEAHKVIMKYFNMI